MHPYLILLARLTLGIVWVTAGLAKRAQKEQVGESVAEFGLLPPGAAGRVGALLPSVELLLGLLLLAGLATKAAAAASAALLFVFSIAIAVNLLRGRRFACRCFGELGEGEISWLSVLRNAGLAAFALILALGRTDYLSLDGWWKGTARSPADPPPLDFLPVFLIAAGITLAGMLVAAGWQVALATARAQSGPALGMEERRLLRRWLRLGPESEDAGR
jgi:uncharacterized membrane protein YphA (DoxX/SURF4 family)